MSLPLGTQPGCAVPLTSKLTTPRTTTIIVQVIKDKMMYAHFKEIITYDNQSLQTPRTTTGNNGQNDHDKVRKIIKNKMMYANFKEIMTTIRKLTKQDCGKIHKRERLETEPAVGQRC